MPTADELLDGAGPDLRMRWNRHGLELTDIRATTTDEIAASGSSWAKRLLAPGVRDRRAVSLTLRRAGRHADSDDAGYSACGHPAD
jgi:hypothetical protein